MKSEKTKSASSIIAAQQDAALIDIQNLISLDKGFSKAAFDIKKIIENRQDGESAKDVLSRIKKVVNKRLSKPFSWSGLFQKSRNEFKQQFYKAIQNLDINNPNRDELINLYNRYTMRPASETKQVK